MTAGFNPRLHAGGDQRWNRCITIWKYCFNPRLHAGGDGNSRRALGRTTVSIHASTREATGSVEMSYDDVISFNPRLHAGGDLQPFSLFRPIFYCFNPRLHAGGDWRYVELHRYQSLVSIHASTREATLLSAFLLMSLACFNPRLHAGGDCNSGDFQAARIAVSIHASTREATSAIFLRLLMHPFQSTPPRGRRRTRYHP